MLTFYLSTYISYSYREREKGKRAKLATMAIFTVGCVLTCIGHTVKEFELRVGKHIVCQNRDDSNEKLSFDVEAQNTVAVAEVTLLDFRCWFTIFLIDFYLHTGFQGILDPLGEMEIPLYTSDLSAIIGSMDLFVGVHKYTTGNGIVIIFAIPEVPPRLIVSLALSGLDRSPYIESLKQDSQSIKCKIPSLNCTRVVAYSRSHVSGSTNKGLTTTYD